MASILQQADFLFFSLHGKDRAKLRGYKRTLERGGKLRKKSISFLRRKYKGAKRATFNPKPKGEICYYAKGVYAPKQASKAIDWEAQAGGLDGQDSTWSQAVDALIDWLEANDLPVGIVKLNRKGVSSSFELGTEDNACSVQVLIRGAEFSQASRQLVHILEGFAWKN